MDSINQQQEEENHEDLNSAEATKKIKEIGEKAQSCFFCTNISAGQPITARPMSVQQFDEEGNCWFLSASDSHKNAELQSDPQMQLFFQGSAHSDFLSLYGRGEVSTDKAKVKELWQPILKTWFTEGEDDPRITVIKFTPSQGYYWDTKHGRVVALVKMLAGAVSGKTMDDSIEGNISL
jgi:general stress protein 26